MSSIKRCLHKSEPRLVAALQVPEGGCRVLAARPQTFACLALVLGFRSWGFWSPSHPGYSLWDPPSLSTSSWKEEAPRS